MADAGVPVHVLRKIAGHGSLTTTQRYLHPDERSITEAGDALTTHLSVRSPMVPSCGSSTPRGGRGFPMPIRIGEGVMQLEIDGRIVATATERTCGWWEVTYWPRFFDRNQAITALTVTQLLESGRDSNDPLVVALRGELR